MILKDNYCKECGKKYTDTYKKWCKPCQMDYLKDNFTNWTSGSENIDDFIQEMQLLNVHYPYNKIFEWIPYNQFSCIKEIGKGGFATIYSAIWKDGPMCYNSIEKKLERTEHNKKVALKCLYDSQSITNEFLNEVL
jgi:hypothetical protein